MLKLFNSKQKNNFFFSSLGGAITTDKSVISINTTKENTQSNTKIGNTRYYPPSTKEWFNSIYVFNKTYVKSLTQLDNIVNNILKSYFNMSFLQVNDLLKFRRRRVKAKRSSANRIFLSRAEFKHTANKVIITLYTYNKQKYYFIHKLVKLQLNLAFRKTLYLIPLINWKSMLISKILTLKQILFLVNPKISFYVNSDFSSLGQILKTNKENYIRYKKRLLISNLKSHNHKNIKKILSVKNKNKILSLINISIFTKKIYLIIKQIFSVLTPLAMIEILFLYYYKTLIIKRYKIRKWLLRKQMLYLYYNKLLLLNKYKFTNLLLNNHKGFNLSNLLTRIYGKKVEFNIVDLKSVHLNSDLLSSAIALKLRNRKNNIVRILKKALSTVKLPPTYIFLISDNETDNINTLNKSEMENSILNSIKYKAISGIRLEGSGRLTRRLIASRSIFKFKYKGSLKNIDSSYKNLSSVILRGHVKSNLQYTLINSKTRNGAFGLKGWVSSY